MIEIVKAGERHVPDIGKLWWEFMKYSEAVNPVISPEDNSIPLFEEKYLRPAMNNDNSLLLAATEDGKVIGYCYALIVGKSDLEKKEPYGCIHDLFVTENARHRGTGGLLAEQVYAWFRSRKITRVELDILKGNKAAESFWQKKGYSEVQRTVFRII